MKISALITSHNYIKYIQDAIESVLSQTYPATEIIIVDDGSTDGSADFLKERFGAASNITIINTVNGGQLAAICKGLTRATGDAISLLDADDVWESSYLSRVAACLEADDTVDMVMTNMRFFGEKDGIWNESASDADYGITSCLTALSDKPPWIGSPTSAITIRRAFFNRLVPPRFLYEDGRICADDFLVWGGSIIGGHKYYIGETLVNYRLHGTNNWAKSAYSPLRAGLKEMRNLRIVSYYRRLAFGTEYPSPNIIHYEFKTARRPPFLHLFRYLVLILKTDGSTKNRLLVAAMCVKYWFLQQLKSDRA